MFLSKKILIVDNADSSRNFLRHVLTNAGYTVETVRNSNDAVELVSEYDFDIFFIDTHLPDEEGIKLIKLLREIDGYESIPILAITMGNDDAIKQQCESANVTEWISKPVSPTGVIALLRKMGMTNTHQAQSLS